MSALALVSVAASLLFSVAPGVADDDHVVVPGDTLSRIAKDYGVSVRELVEANDLDDPNVIVIGEVLRIPGIDGMETVMHQVQAGETLSQIAARYGTTVQALAAANGIVDINRIFVGSQLTISGGGASEPDPDPEPATTPTPEIGTGVSTYTVVRGDTLSSIAARYDTTVKRLMELNDLTDPNLIQAGQRLKVPGTGFTCPVSNAVYIDDWHFPRPGGRIHLGTDLFAPSDAPVFAPVSGELEQIDGTLGGLQFWLEGDDGNLYIGSHLSAFGLDGRVAAGDLVGYVGQSGNAKTTPPHLHFEIIVGGVEINPYDVLKANGC